MNFVGMVPARSPAYYLFHFEKHNCKTPQIAFALRKVLFNEMSIEKVKDLMVAFEFHEDSL